MLPRFCVLTHVARQLSLVMCVDGSQSAMQSAIESFADPPASCLTGPPPVESGGLVAFSGALGVEAAPTVPPEPVVDGIEPGGGSGAIPGGACAGGPLADEADGLVCNAGGGATVFGAAPLVLPGELVA